MAEERNKEKKEEGAENSSTEAQASKRTLLFAIAGAVALAVGIGTPLTLYLFSGPSKAEQELERLTMEIAQQTLELQIEGFEEDEFLEDDEERLGVIYPFQTFIVNLTDGGYLRIQVQVEFAEQVISRRFYQRLVPIEDAMISLLSGRSKEDLLLPNVRQQLRSDIREEINRTLRREDVRNVYFTQFIVQ